MRKKYARKLTKEELLNGGITLITEEGLVFKGDKQVIPSINQQGYLMLTIYELDEDGNKIKVPMKKRFKGCKNLIDSYNYKCRVVGLHRAMWAWFYGEVPDGYVCDHISNQHKSIEDYHLSNLQLLTPAENLAKEKTPSKRVIKSKWATKERYERLLEIALKEYEEAKLLHNADEAHKQRSKIAYYKARLRYFIN